MDFSNCKSALYLNGSKHVILFHEFETVFLVQCYCVFMNPLDMSDLCNLLYIPVINFQVQASSGLGIGANMRGLTSCPTYTQAVMKAIPAILSRAPEGSLKHCCKLCLLIFHDLPKMTFIMSFKTVHFKSSFAAFREKKFFSFHLIVSRINFCKDCCCHALVQNNRDWIGINLQRSACLVRLAMYCSW